jgi:ubiquinone/menaquinone biosynthesis C-methylase UbiE
LNVLEIGPGTGANLQYLPQGARWVGVEPNPFMHKALRAAAAARGVHAQIIAASAEVLQLPDDSFDAAIGTLVLCSVPRPQRAVEELRRVLKPGGRFYFIEHVAADRGSWLRLAQRWVRPAWRFLGDGCCPDRETEAVIRSAGFSAVECESFRAPRKALPWIVSPQIAGWATK